MSSFIRRNGFGPSARWLIGMMAYQNRRSVFCCAVSIGSALRRDGTVVPMTQQKLLQTNHQAEQGQPGHGDQQQRGEHARDIEQ